MTSFLFIGQGGGGGGTTDHFAPTIIVGNVLAGDPAVAQAAPFRYIPDPGDGSGIALALSEAVALSAGVVHIRRGQYGLTDPAVFPLTVPPGVIVRGEGWGDIGSGVGGTLIAAPLSVTQRMFVMGENSALEDLLLLAASPTGEITDTAGIGMVESESIFSMRRVFAFNTAQGNSDKVQRAVVWSRYEHPHIEACRFVCYANFNPNEQPSIGIVVGNNPDNPVDPFKTPDTDQVIEGTRIEASTCVLYRDIAGGSISDCDFWVIGSGDVVNAQGVYVQQVEAIPNGTDLSRMPMIAKVRVTLDSSASSNCDGLLVEANPSAVSDPLQRLVVCGFDVEALNFPVGEQTALRLRGRAGLAAAGSIRRCAISDVLARGLLTYGIRLQVSEGEQVDASIANVRITNFVMEWNEALVTYGIALENGSSDASIDSVGVVNCDLSGHGVGQTGVLIQAAAITRTSIGFCSLNGNGTTHLDNGTLTEMGHNQLT